MGAKGSPPTLTEIKCSWKYNKHQFLFFSLLLIAGALGQESGNLTLSLPSSTASFSEALTSSSSRAFVASGKIRKLQKLISKISSGSETMKIYV